LSYPVPVPYPHLGIILHQEYQSPIYLVLEYLQCGSPDLSWLKSNTNQLIGMMTYPTQGSNNHAPSTQTLSKLPQGLLQCIKQTQITLNDFLWRIFPFVTTKVLYLEMRHHTRESFLSSLPSEQQWNSWKGQCKFLIWVESIGKRKILLFLYAK
jgi:hypothetical protein